MGKHISAQIPGSKFIPFEKSGHLPFYEESDKFNSSLTEFLKEIRGGDRAIFSELLNKWIGIRGPVPGV